MLLASGTTHTLKAVQAVARERGLEAEVEPGLCTVRGVGLAEFAIEASDTLSATERAEVRAHVLGDGLADPVVAALSAPSLETLAARHRYRDVFALLEDPSAFYARYQPIVDLADERVVAYEALLRAVGPAGEVTPDRLFGAASAAGWVHVLDRIGRETAIAGAAGWLGDRTLFINFVPTSIYRPELCLRTTERAANVAGIDLQQVVFEVVESDDVEDTSHLQRIISYYRERGCRVALDDVGSGFSGLNRLVELQPDVVKLDMKLVQALPSEAATAVIKALVAMSHDLGAIVLGEGVETERQRDALVDLGVDLAQGWFYGRPELKQADPTTTPVTVRATR